MGINNEEIAVSIICNTYNHEKYIGKALEGFVIQKTNFNYEVIVHDDASTDDTAKIIEQYRGKYPNIIKPIYEQNNMYFSGKRYLVDIELPYIKGRYVAFCEGDDFWTSDDKLQQQFDFMEGNEECSLCVHKAVRVKEDGTDLSDYYDYSSLITEGSFLSREYVIRNMGCFPLNSMFFRTEFINNNKSILMMLRGYDYVFKILLATEGRIYLIDEYMSAYRVSSQGSWSDRTLNSSQKLVDHLTESIDYISTINEYRKFEYDEVLSEEMLYRNYQVLIYKRKFNEALQKKYKIIRKKIGIKHSVKVYLGAIFQLFKMKKEHC